MKEYILILILILAVCLFAEEEIEPLNDDIIIETEIVEPEPEQSTEHDPTDLVEVHNGFYLPRSPAKAAYLSAFLPGAGQLYNEKYLKSAFVFGIQGSLVARTVYHNQRTQKFKARKNDSYENMIKYHEAYENRQSFVFWIGFSVLLSAMDAYVDAHLINYEKLRDEIHIRFEHDKVVLSIRF